MSSLENMRSLLRPLGLYRLDGESLVDRELAVYAAAMDKAEERARNAVTGALPFSAEGEQLDGLLKLMGAEELAMGMENDKKRELLTALLSVRASSFTNRDFLDLVEAMGGQGATVDCDVYLREILLSLPDVQQKSLFAKEGKRYGILCRLLPPDYSLLIV